MNMGILDREFRLKSELLILKMFQKLMIFEKNGTFHVLCIEFWNKCSRNYAPECFIFQNGITCFRYNLVCVQIFFWP